VSPGTSGISSCKTPYHPLRRGIQEPNFAKVAQALGAKGSASKNPGDVREGLAVGFAHKYVSSIACVRVVYNTETAVRFLNKSQIANARFEKDLLLETPLAC